MKIVKLLLACVLLASLTGCATWAGISTDTSNAWHSLVGGKTAPHTTTYNQ